MATPRRLKTELPIASREYACALCGHPILAGKTYQCDRVREGQTFKTVRSHVLCPLGDWMPEPASEPVWRPSEPDTAQAILIATGLVIAGLSVLAFIHELGGF